MKSFHLAKILFSALCISMLSSCDNSQATVSDVSKKNKLEVKPSGFKSVQFSMNSKQLENLGFNCAVNKQACDKKADKGETLFGKPADIDAILVNDKVSELEISISMEPQEMVDLYSQSLGKSKILEYVAMTGQKIRLHYWTLSDGTGIEVMVSLAKDAQDNQLYKMIGPRAHASYKDQSATEKSLKQIESLSSKPRDL
jgi:hypothetical protein